MSSGPLTPVSYVVLGLVARDGPCTPYDIKSAVGRGIAHFWPFPHSQIYSETEHLAGLGLLAEERERTGRRRRTFRLTAAGGQALAAWLGEPTADLLQVRSYAFLQLYFGRFGRAEDVLALATVQIGVLESQQRAIGGMLERLEADPDRRWQLALADVYARLTRSAVQGWKRVAVKASQEASGGRRAAPRRRRRRIL